MSAVEVGLQRGTLIKQHRGEFSEIRKFELEIDNRQSQIRSFPSKNKEDQFRSGA